MSLPRPPWLDAPGDLAPMSRRPPWSDAPGDLLDRFLSLLPCAADAASFAATCRSWRESARRRSAGPRQLPWLIFPTPSHRYTFHSLLSRPSSRHLSLPPAAAGGRILGSFGKWLAVADSGNAVCSVVDPFSGSHHLLPPGNIVDAALLVFSSNPGGAEGKNCMAARVCNETCGICGTYGTVSLWKPLNGQQLPDFKSRLITKSPEDILYFHDHGNDKCFYAVTTLEELLLYRMRDDGHRFELVEAILHPMWFPDGSGLRRRYLVVSRGKLLLVVRIYELKKGWKMIPRTCSFRVFELHPLCHPMRVPYDYTEVYSLEGEMIFVGRGCSKSVDASEYSEFEPDTIFFTDDDFMVPAGEVNHEQYPCFGIGKFSLKDGSIETIRTAEYRSGLYPPM